MKRLVALYEPDESAVLSGGAWSLPASNLLDERMWRIARSVYADPASTQIRIAMAGVKSISAIILGPTNLTTAYRYRLRKWANSEFAEMLDDFGWIKPFDGIVGGVFDLEWEDVNFWFGVVPYDDAERGINIIHTFDEPVSGQYWTLEIEDPGNPDGFVQAGWLFIARAFTPSINYAPEGNGLGFRDNSMRQPALNGGESVWRRTNPRVFTAQFPYLREDEGYSDLLRLFRVAGYDGRIFLIPEPDDAQHIQERSFFARFKQQDPIAQHLVDYIGSGFQIEEII